MAAVVNAMAEVVTIRVPKEEKPEHPPSTAWWLATLRRLLGLPLRVAAGVLEHCWNRLIGGRNP